MWLPIMWVLNWSYEIHPSILQSSGLSHFNSWEFDHWILVYYQFQIASCSVLHFLVFKSMISQEICYRSGHMEVFYKLVICILCKYIQISLMLYSGDCHHGNCNVFNYDATWYCHATYLWWRHMGWNPNVDGTMLSIVESRKQHILGSWWWSVPRISLVFWIFSTHICLFTPIMCIMCFFF